jgi:hypothetical protein
MVAMQIALQMQLIISNSHHSMNQRVIKPFALCTVDISHSNTDEGSDGALVSGSLPLWEKPFTEGSGVPGMAIRDRVGSFEQALDEVAVSEVRHRVL